MPTEPQGDRIERDEWWAEAMADPARRERFEQMHEQVVKGELSLAQVGGFSEDEIENAYAGATKLLATGKVREALQVAGYLILLSPHEARLYYLAGLCMHRLNKLHQAVQYYGVAIAGSPSGVTLVARGEALLMLGRLDEARVDLERGIASLSPTEKATKPHLERAQQLLSIYVDSAPGSGES